MLFAVDVEGIVTFAKPVADAILRGKHGSHVVPVALIPFPKAKKSPMGTSTEGTSAPSQQIRNTRARGQRMSFEEGVNQMCLISPGPFNRAMAVQ